jgi:arsenate reductase (thioredoxin)
MDKKKVLFICVHNAARSQMAAAWLQQIAGDKFEVESAGLEPGVLNPLAVAVMQETGIDISQNKTKSVWDLYKQGKRYHYVIAVCDESQAAKCPVFPGALNTIHWSFADPAGFQGTWEQKMEKTRVVRDEIKSKIAAWSQDPDKESPFNIKLH